MNESAPYGFRIVGDCRNERRLVNAANALTGYSTCDLQAEVEREAYLSAFQFGEAFRQHLERTGSTKGYRGLCWSPWLWFDIDNENNLDVAAVDARKLAASLVERYRIDGDDLLLFFSGSKGFHVGLPMSLASSPAPSPTFHKIARRYACDLADQFGVTIDTGIYDRVRAFRAPNSRHPKTDLHKRRVTFDELLGLKVTALVQMASDPEPFELPIFPGAKSQAEDDWASAALVVESEVKALAEQRQAVDGPSLNRLTLEFIRDGAIAGDRHRLLFSAAANLAEFGCPASLAHALLADSGLNLGLPPKDVRRQIECGLERGTA